MRNDRVKCTKCRKEHYENERVLGDLEKKYLPKLKVRKNLCPFCGHLNFKVIKKEE